MADSPISAGSINTQNSDLPVPPNIDSKRPHESIVAAIEHKPQIVISNEPAEERIEALENKATGSNDLGLMPNAEIPPPLITLTEYINVTGPDHVELIRAGNLQVYIDLTGNDEEADTLERSKPLPNQKLARLIEMIAAFEDHLRDTVSSSNLPNGRKRSLRSASSIATGDDFTSFIEYLQQLVKDLRVQAILCLDAEMQVSESFRDKKRQRLN